MRLFILIMVLFLYNNCYSQYIKCSSEENSLIEDNIQKKVGGEEKANLLDLRDEIVLPLVFHVFNKRGSELQITEADIYRQLDILNDAFSANNFDKKNVPNVFKELISNTAFKFCIGYRENDSEVESGILFFETNEDNLGDELLEHDNRRRKIKYNTSGGDDGWDSKKYINIWIGEMANSGGHSTFPDEDTLDDWRNEAGIIINLNTLPGTGANGKILIHEMGHYFNLKHIWGSDKFGCDVDDGVEDTPLQFEPYTGCPIGVNISCGSRDMYMNYMDYTNDECSLMFSLGQSDRMRAALMNYRSTLLNSEEWCYFPEFDDNPLEKIKISIDINNNIILYRNFNYIEDIDIVIYNISGKMLFKHKMEKGQMAESVSYVDFKYGMYFVTLKSGKYSDTRKFVIFQQ